MPHVSIIVPTLNEIGCLDTTLRHLCLLDPPAFEVIVADGGSQDGTVELAEQIFKDFPTQTKTYIVHCEERGRSQQMNRGAKVATGDILCFLHADTLIPHDAIAVIQYTLESPVISCGGFISLMTGTHTTRWGVSLHNYLKTYYAPLLFRPYQFFRGLRLLFGDQVMFCRYRDFWDCSGFDPTLPIMEEADLCLKLTAKGAIRQVNRVVRSSDRRVAQWGAWKATAIYLYIGFLWGIGVSSEYLKQFYEDIR